MKKFTLIFLTFLFFHVSSRSQTELTAEQTYEALKNSVVVIICYGKGKEVYQGSGVIVSREGYVATNAHLCSDSDRIEIKHYDKEFKNIETVLSDSDKDILILKIKDCPLPPVKVGTSKGLKTGQRIYAIGSPEGYENTISEGIISGFRTDWKNNSLIQMTTPITEGSSGGAVLNSYGELIGLSTSGQHEGNLYFAIPVDDIVNILSAKNIAVSREESINYFQQGSDALSEHKYNEAVDYFTKHLAKFSNDVNAYFERGYASLKLNQYKLAINDFSRAIDMNSRHTDSYFYRGNAYYYQEDFANALKDFNKCIELNPDLAVFYYNRGFTNYRLKKYENALKDWTKTIELNPDYQKELEKWVTPLKKKLNIN